MPYPQRQQELLTAMGIVPWVQRGSDSSTLDVVGSVGNSIASAESVSQDEIGIADRPLCALAKGVAIGNVSAPLLVVVETAELIVTTPLAGDAAQLFEQMMRSIDVTRAAVCQCAISTNSASVANESETLSSLVSLERAVGLVLTHEIDDNEDPSAHAFDLVIDGRNPLPMWRIPHPDLLLAQPLRKRQAWQILKAVRRALSP